MQSGSNAFIILRHGVRAGGDGIIHKKELLNTHSLHGIIHVYGYVTRQEPGTEGESLRGLL